MAHDAIQTKNTGRVRPQKPLRVLRFTGAHGGWQSKMRLGARRIGQTCPPPDAALVQPNAGRLTRTANGVATRTWAVGTHTLKLLRSLMGIGKMDRGSR